MIQAQLATPCDLAARLGRQYASAALRADAEGREAGLVAEVHELRRELRGWRKAMPSLGFAWPCPATAS